MFHIVLYQPEIPPNTGNIMRLCANTGARLHLIKPLGFKLEDKELRRAGLDYREWAPVQTHASFDDFLAEMKPTRILAFSTKALRLYSEIQYQENDFLLFGPETRGLPQDLMEKLPTTHRLKIPLLPDNRSLNLSNAAAVAVYEAWRQLAFRGAK